MTKTSDGDQELWLFGYGSLIWKPPPHFDLRVPGYVEGYVRRFWQASEDHRGTPEAPGRVVTLIDRSHWETLVDEHSDAPATTWGAAYRVRQLGMQMTPLREVNADDEFQSLQIPGPHVAEVREYLDIREINGYSIQYTPFHVSRSFAASYNLPAPINCLVYVGLPDNPQFMGPQDPQSLAEHIVRSRGPSGENKDYLYGLDQSLLELGEGSEDEHVHDLARRCRDIEGRSSQDVGRRSDSSIVGSELRRAGSTEEQEEIEK
ncbi:ChaC-like protein [Aureobasidium subglaciale]|nr:ChaC-like protein [Aureobasidium subglaciale]